ncbi:MAG: hypothetical protein VX000_14745, partial [Myxococcota bacterium]|nr:hypothetical protein [Myxococcota bacterium]
RHGAGARVRRSILMSGCDVGEGAVVQNAILDKNCRVLEGAQIGVDAEADRARFPFITEGGRVVLPKGTVVPARGPVEFAGDIGPLLEIDAATRDAMTALGGRYVIAERDRHSFQSAGPRYAYGARGTGLIPGRQD